MDPFCKVLLGGTTEPTYKLANDLEEGDVLYPQQTVMFKSSTNGLMFEIVLENSTSSQFNRVVLDHNTNLLVYIPCHPIVDFDETSSTFKVEYIQETERFIKTKIPLRNISKINTIRKQHSDVHFLSVATLERILRSGMGKNGIFAMSKCCNDSCASVENGNGNRDVLIGYHQITSIKQLNEGLCIRLFFDPSDGLPTHLPIIIEGGFVVK